MPQEESKIQPSQEATREELQQGEGDRVKIVLVGARIRQGEGDRVKIVLVGLRSGSYHGARLCRLCHGAP